MSQFSVTYLNTKTYDVIQYRRVNVDTFSNVYIIYNREPRRRTHTFNTGATFGMLTGERHAGHHTAGNSYPHLPPTPGAGLPSGTE